MDYKIVVPKTTKKADKPFTFTLKVANRDDVAVLKDMLGAAPTLREKVFTDLRKRFKKQLEAN